MKVQSKPPAPVIQKQQAPAPTPPPPQEPHDKLDESTPVLTKVGKWALALGTTAGGAALGWYAGTIAPGHTAAALLSTGMTGAVTGFTLSTLDFQGGSNPMTGAAIGGGVGAVAGLLMSGHSWGGVVMAIGGGLAGLAVTSAATNLLHK